MSLTLIALSVSSENMRTIFYLLLPVSSAGAPSLSLFPLPRQGMKSVTLTSKQLFVGCMVFCAFIFFYSFYFHRSQTDDYIFGPVFPSEFLPVGGGDRVRQEEKHFFVLLANWGQSRAPKTDQMLSFLTALRTSNSCCCSTALQSTSLLDRQDQDNTKSCVVHVATDYPVELQNQFERHALLYTEGAVRLVFYDSNELMNRSR